MTKDELYEIVLNTMLDSCKHNIVVSRIREGKLELGVSNSTVEVVDPSGKKHYLVHVKDVVYLKNGAKITLNGHMRNAIAKEFLSRYTYKDILSYYDSYIDSIKSKIDKANKTKHLLNNLAIKLINISDVSVEPELLTDNIQYKYYIRYKLDIVGYIDIYLGEEEGIYNCKHNCNWINLTESELISKIRGMVLKYKKELKVQEEYKVNQMREEDKERLIDNFIDSIWYSNKRVIVKLKSGYQCISKGTRYSVGTGKEGRFYNIHTWYKLKEYIEKKGINEYYILKEGDSTSKLTDDILKKLPYIKIIA